METLHHFNVNPESFDRFPQWSMKETKDFLIVRSEFDNAFMETKRNKLLWEVIASKMKEKGYNRSADQCKCKWKNLVTRYKGSEAMGPEAAHQFPFYVELKTIFAGRMQRLLMPEADGGGSSGAKKKGLRLSSDEEESNDESIGEEKGNKKKQKTEKVIRGNTNSKENNVREILEEFMRQQLQMEVQWFEAAEARENERRLREMEWRQTMEALEKERIMMDRMWREREEQRRMREEARAEKRDALISTLLSKLTREDIERHNT